MTPAHIRDLLRQPHSDDPNALRVRALLRSELERLRAACDLPAPALATSEALLDDVERIFRTRNKPLQALAVLDAHFHPDVRLTLDSIAERALCDARTLRRIQQLGCELLAERFDAAAAPTAPADGLGGERVPGPPVPANTNLVAPTNRFVGRERELALVEGLVEANRVVVLRGEGGIGKTRLATEVALRLVDRFPDGVWLVELEHLDVPELLPLALATVVRPAGAPSDDEAGDAPAPGDDPLARLAERRALVVLDGCERLSAAVAALLAELRVRAPELRVLATTRHLADAIPDASWRVAALDVPPPDATEADAIARVPAVALFVERLRAARAGFAVDDGNAALVAGLVRRLDGMPLAIEIAAGCAAQLPLAAVAAEIAPTIARRTRRSAPYADTPASVLAAIDVGLGGLDPRERRFMARLAVFEGSFDLEAVRAVCTDDGDEAPSIARADVPPLLATLLRGALVVAGPAGPAPRYRLLEAIRAFAVDLLLRDGLEARVRRRHAEYFAALAGAAREALRGVDAEHWTTRLSLEHDNLRAAMRHLGDEDPARALRMAADLAECWQIAGQLSAGRQALDTALARYDAAGLPPESAERQAALSAAGALARGQHDVEAASRYLRAALDMARRSEDARALSMALRRYGNFLEEQGERAPAAALYRESAEICAAIGDARGVAAAHNNLGILADHEGRHQDAAAHLRAGLAAIEALDDAFLASILQANLAMALAELGHWEESLATYQSALRTSRLLVDRVGVASNLIAMAYLEIGHGDPRRTWAYLAEALPHVEATADRQKCAEWLERAVWLLSIAGLREAACAALGAADGLRARWSIEILPKDQAERTQLAALLDEALGAERARALRAAAEMRRWQEVAAEVLALGRSEAEGD